MQSQTNISFTLRERTTDSTVPARIEGGQNQMHLDKLNKYFGTKLDCQNSSLKDLLEKTLDKPAEISLSAFAYYNNRSHLDDSEIGKFEQWTIPLLIEQFPQLAKFFPESYLPIDYPEVDRLCLGRVDRFLARCSLDDQSKRAVFNLHIRLAQIEPALSQMPKTDIEPLISKTNFLPETLGALANLEESVQFLETACKQVQLDKHHQSYPGMRFILPTPANWHETYRALHANYAELRENNILAFLANSNLRSYRFDNASECEDLAEKTKTAGGEPNPGSIEEFNYKCSSTPEFLENGLRLAFSNHATIRQDGTDNWNLITHKIYYLQIPTTNLVFMRASDPALIPFLFMQTNKDAKLLMQIAEELTTKLPLSIVHCDRDKMSFYCSQKFDTRTLDKLLNPLLETTSLQKTLVSDGNEGTVLQLC